MLSSRHRVRWCSFSLKWLLSVMALSAFCVNYFANVRRQQLAIAAIKQVHGSFYYGFQGDGEEYSDVTTPAGPGWLWRLADVSYVSHVVAVDLNCCGADDATLAKVANLRQLQVVRISNAPLITDCGLKHLSQLRRLNHIVLDYAGTTDAGLINLKDLAALETLELRGTMVTEVGLINLRQMQQLKKLTISGHRNSPDTIKEIRRAMPHCTIEVD